VNPKPGWPHLPARATVDAATLPRSAALLADARESDDRVLPALCSPPQTAAAWPPDSTPSTVALVSNGRPFNFPRPLSASSSRSNAEPGQAAAWSEDTSDDREIGNKPCFIDAKLLFR
jgi:hypothetical protein